MKTFTRSFMAAMFAPLLFAFTCVQRPAVTGHIEGLGNDSLKVEIIQLLPESENDEFMRILEFSIYAEDGRFSLDTIGEYPVIVTMIPNSLFHRRHERRIEMLLSPGEYAVIKGVVAKDKPFDYEITGTDMNRDLSHLRRLQMPLELKIDSLNRLIKKDITATELFEQRAKLIEENVKYLYDHINNNPDAVSAGIVAVWLPLDSLGVYYAKLGEKAKSNFFARKYLQRKLKEVEEYRKAMEAKERIVAGADAPRFTLKSSDGGQVSLTDVKDKYIVLDFWGTWCGPCMAGVPRMKKCYEYYKDKVEFIGIACNDTEKKWLETVAKEELPWISLIEDPKNKISIEYALEVYPTKIILDKDYRIVEIFRGEGDDFYIKLDELLK